MMYRTFEQALLGATDVVIAHYVGHRPFGATLTEFEFTVIDRILGNAADTIFVYASRGSASIMGGAGASSYDQGALSFTSGTEYVLALSGLSGATANTHPDGFTFIYNLIIDLSNPTESTMYGEPISLHATEINFNSRSLNREQIIAFVTEATADNPPGNSHIRSDNIVDIVAGSSYILVVDINEPLRLVDAQVTRDWVETDIYHTTVVSALKGDINAGFNLEVVFFANTVQTGERHIVAVEQLEPRSSMFLLTSPHSLFNINQLDEIMTVLANDNSNTVTLENGGARARANPAIAVPGQEVTIGAGFNHDGREFVRWESAQGVVFADPNAARTTFVMPDGPVTVTAVWG